MADCSYARCVQERRNIKRELQKWTKNMVYVVGLERVAEELMGRRRWKLYQEVLALSRPPNSAPADPTVPPAASLEQDRPVSTTLDCMKQEGDDTKPVLEDLPKPDKLDPRVIPDRTHQDTVTLDEATLVTPKEEPDEPIAADWKPQDKCYFCVDGKLLRVNSSGALVTAKTNEGDHTCASTLAASPRESDSESSDSASDTDLHGHPLSIPSALASKTVVNLFQQSQQMASLESMTSMAASLAAVAALSNNANLQGSSALGMPGLSFYPPGLFPHWYHMAAQQGRAFLPERMAEITEKPSPTPEGGSTEQPLDLSAKAGGSSGDPKLPTNMRMPVFDAKHIFKAKPRMSAVAGRRTYTEDELQAALRDIQSGKLGTRRAAVIYGIPRSTLRNKVYKLAMERERETHLLLPSAAALQTSLISPIALATLTAPSGSTPDIKLEDDDANDDDKELSGAEDEKEVEKALQGPLLSMEDILRFSSLDNPAFAATEGLRHLLQKGKFFDADSSAAEQLTGSTPDTWPGTDHSALGPYIRSLLMARELGRMPQPGTSDGDHMAGIPELMKMMADEQLLRSEYVNNGKASETIEEDMLHKRLLARHVSASSSSVIMRPDRRTTETPEASSETGDPGDDSASNVILKIPSFKPIAAGQSQPNNVSKNGGEGVSSNIPPHFYNRSPIIDNNQIPGHLSVISPPIGSGLRGSNTSESSSPPIIPGKGIVSLREVIAKSISQKFQQQGHSSQNETSSKHTSPNIDALEGLNTFKRERTTPPMVGQGISVIKNLGGHDLSRNFGGNSNNSNTQNNTTGGKGTRPKRGKYRNYDRDSLVEAVKAVQRGEMSVHRAGSYYGVPHSTLEYKVKERHLMRPRKREPKPQPPEEKSLASNPKTCDIPGSNVLRIDKSKGMPKPQIKGPFPSSSPNGLKMPPMFDPNLAQLGYSPSFPFWPHAPPFHGLPMEFSRNQPSASFPPTPEAFFASQMMQRLQDESSRHAVNTSSVIASGKTSTPNPASTKSAREMAESLYDGTGANGSFLDGIIRSSLEMGLPNHRSKATDPSTSNALLDQLVRNNKTPQSSGEESATNPKSPANLTTKRPSSPFNLAHELKRQAIDLGQTKIKYSPSGETSPLNFAGKQSPGISSHRERMYHPRSTPSPRHHTVDKVLGMGYNREKLTPPYKAQEYLPERPMYQHGKLNPYIKEEIHSVELSNDSTDSAERRRKSSTEEDKYSSSPRTDLGSDQPSALKSQLRMVQTLQEDMKIAQEMREMERRRDNHERSRRKSGETYKYHSGGGNGGAVTEHNGTNEEVMAASATTAKGDS